jgi:hypothetical protein
MRTAEFKNVIGAVCVEHPVCRAYISSRVQGFDSFGGAWISEVCTNAVRSRAQNLMFILLQINLIGIPASGDLPVLNTESQ